MWLYPNPTPDEIKKCFLSVDASETYRNKETGELFTGVHSFVKRGLRNKAIYSSVKWFVNGKYHRENDLPAKYYHTFFDQGSVYHWYKNGLIHRENGPAVMGYKNFTSARLGPAGMQNTFYGYFIEGVDVTESIKDWSKNNSVPLYKLTDTNIFKRALKEM